MRPLDESERRAVEQLLAAKAQRVRSLAEAYERECFPSGELRLDPKTVLGDLICDLLHLADRLGAEAERVVDQALLHYRAETLPDQDTIDAALEQAQGEPGASA